jgi:hypothetical protein
MLGGGCSPLISKLYLSATFVVKAIIMMMMMMMMIIIIIIIPSVYH